MPTDTATATSSKRLSSPRDHGQPSIVAHSPQDNTPSHKQSTPSHKQQKHVVGHGKLGARNPSYGRNLSKLVITAPNNDDAGRGGGAIGSPLSPRFRSANGKRSMQRNASGTALRKNVSSGHLHRNTSGNISAKHLSKSHRPEYNRSKSHDGERKAKRLKSPPPPNGKHAAVHFDMGSDDDEAEEMEGVDDGWTEESASQSPNTTRDNTRSNTRNNSVVLDPEQNPYRKKEEERPPDSAGPKEDNKESKRTEDTSHEDDEVTPTAPHARKSSYHDAHQQQKPPDAEAIAKRLLQRHDPRPPQPQISDVSATADGSPNVPGSPVAEANRPSPSIASGPLVSRFIDSSTSQPGSKDGTPRTPAPLTSSRPQTATSTASGSQILAQHQKSPLRSRAQPDNNIRRNQSTPSFVLPPSPPAGDGTGSGTNTPGGPLRQSRTQQKLWLQRGLSNIEAASQSNLPGLLMSGGHLRRGGASSAALSAMGGAGGMVGVAERIERELVAVRRYRNPVEESIARLRKVKGGNVGVVLRGSKVLAEKGGSPKKAVKGKKEGGTTPKSAASRSRAVSREREEEGRKDGRDWTSMSLRELEEATMDVRRQMWELQSSGDVAD